MNYEKKFQEYVDEYNQRTFHKYSIEEVMADRQIITDVWYSIPTDLDAIVGSSENIFGYLEQYEILSDDLNPKIFFDILDGEYDDYTYNEIYEKIIKVELRKRKLKLLENI